MNPEALSLPPLRCQEPVRFYRPFASGKYDTSPGLSHFRPDPADPDKRLLQLDAEYPQYRANKQRCRAERFGRYYLEEQLPAATLRCVNQLLIEQLCQSYPAYFQLQAPGLLKCLLSGQQLRFAEDYHLLDHPFYQSLLDALADQIQEDLAIWQLEGQRDWLAALHVCAPNGWAPADKIGQNFAQVHLSVPGMERQLHNYLPLLRGLIQKPAFCRFIWDLRSCSELNHHPEVARPAAFNPDAPELYLRLERQLLYGLPQQQAVLFLIRSYRYAVTTLAAQDLLGLEQALTGMSPELKAYKRLAEDEQAISDWLRQLRQKLA